jgi:hypothetical protein
MTGPSHVWAGNASAPVLPLIFIPLEHDDGLLKINQDIPYGRRSRRRGRFIVPTADLSALAGYQIMLLIPIIGLYKSFVAEHGGAGLFVNLHHCSVPF